MKLWITQANYGQGWEDVTASTDRLGGQRDLKDYRDNEPQYPHRLISRDE